MIGKFFLMPGIIIKNAVNTGKMVVKAFKLMRMIDNKDND
jgi:hypothetical protein